MQIPNFNRFDDDLSTILDECDHSERPVFGNQPGTMQHKLVRRILSRLRGFDRSFVDGHVSHALIKSLYRRMEGKGPKIGKLEDFAFKVAWRSVINAVLNHHKTVQKAEDAALSRSPDLYFPRPAPNPSRASEDNEEIALVLSRLERLDSDQDLLCRRRYKTGLNDSEIARRMDIDHPSTVKRRADKMIDVLKHDD